ncbi:hypothetical protein, partial [Paracoccus gahaiensis]|uniref:hypothetical protein n=1 Tax=Paracoccus gahaiensis TaxID=1706839 RepID=UPI001B7FD9B3
RQLDASPGHPFPNFTPVSQKRLAALRLPGPSSVPAFGEAVFRPGVGSPQQENAPPCHNSVIILVLQNYFCGEIRHSHDLPTS